jgi:hypothetical protein
VSELCWAATWTRSDEDAIREGQAAGDPQQQRAERGGKELGVDPKELRLCGREGRT